MTDDQSTDRHDEVRSLLGAWALDAVDDVERATVERALRDDPELAAEAIGAGDSPLTAREADVLEAAGDAAPVEEIAKRVHLSAGTVRNHLSSAATKLGATNRHEAVAMARRMGWI